MGRHGYKEEALVEEVLKLSFITIRQYLSHPDYPLHKKALLAGMLASRRIKDRKEVDTTINLC